MRTFGLIVASMLVSTAPTVASAQAQQPPRVGAPASPARPATAPRPATPPRPGSPARPAAPGLQVPQAAGLVILIRGTLSALNQANQTANYSVLHALGSDTMRTNTNPQALAQAFAGFRQRGADISPLLVLNPQLTQPAVISGGRLHLVGRFPSQPVMLTFDLWYEISQNRWKPVQINASLAPAPAQQGQARPPQGQQPRPAQPRPAQPQQPAQRRQ